MAAFLLTKGFIKATIYFCFAVNNQLVREAKAFPEVIFSLQGPNSVPLDCRATKGNLATVS